MIRSFRCRHTRELFETETNRRFAHLQDAAYRKLVMLHAATHLSDLLLPPGNKLEALKLDRKGQHSIRINQQWRICFRWIDGHAFDVEIVDYH